MPLTQHRQKDENNVHRISFLRLAKGRLRNKIPELQKVLNGVLKPHYRFRVLKGKGMLSWFLFGTCLPFPRGVLQFSTSLLLVFHPEFRFVRQAVSLTYLFDSSLHLLVFNQDFALV